MKTYRGFLFDADNTLFDYDRAESEALADTLGKFLPDVPLAEALSAYHEINAGYWRRFEQGTITLPELKAARFASLFERLGTGGDAEAVSLHYLTSLSVRAYFLPGARDVLHALSRTSALCLVTNGISLVQRGRLEKSGVGGLFHAVLISEELGFAKPDPLFFRAAAEALSLPVEDLLCVGDNPAADIEGARSAGMDACWFAPSGGPWPGPGAPPALIVSELVELLPLAAPLFTKNAI